MSATTSPLPRASFVAVLAILGGTLVCAAAARMVGYANPPAPPPAIATVNLNFFDLADGAVAVRDTDTGRVLSTVPARAGGFLRSTMRVLATERAASHLGPDKPFLLSEYAGNRLVLTDTATGQALELEAFGPSNEAEFAAFLTEAETPK